MVTAYAQPSDLTDGGWLTTVPANAATLLLYATLTVADACQRDIYTDTPSGSDVAPLRDATCSQAAAWVANGIDPAATGLDAAPVKSAKILDGDVTYDTTGQAQARQVAARELAPAARAILHSAGLLWLPVPLGADQFDPLPQWGQGRRWFPYPEPMSGEFEWPYYGDAAWLP